MAQTWKLMVLEDDPQLREVLTSVLQDEGYQVVAVDNGKAAVDLAGRESFDLIITDIRMDGLDGLEALEHARRFQPELSSLVVSGYTTEAETLRALQLNVGGFLKKPFSLGDLLQRVRELLTQRGHQQIQRQAVMGVLHSFWWSLQAGLSAQSDRAREAGTLAFYLAQRLGLKEEVCFACRLAAMMQLVEGGPLQELPATASEDAHGLGPVVQLLQEMRREEPPLPAQVALVASKIHASDEGTWEGTAWDPSLEAILKAEGDQLRNSARVLASEAQGNKALGSGQMHRSLLGLALTLEERGDWEEAQSAYAQLREDPEAGLETRLQAQVGLARVLFQRGQNEFFDVLKEAERESRALGPLAGATQRWPIASLLLRSRHPSAQAYLQGLQGEFKQLGIASAWARAAVAQGWLGGAPEQCEEAVRLLSSPACLGDVASEASWLAPALLSVGAQSGIAPGAWSCRLACQFPAAVTRWFLEEKPDSPGLKLLLAGLEAHPELALSQLVESMGAHADPEVRRRVLALQNRLRGDSPQVFLRFRSFGCFEVYVNGERVPDAMWKTQKYKFLLAYLVARRGHSFPEEVLIEEFWPDSRGSGKASVYSATTTLRRCLRAGQETGEFIIREGDRLLFDPAVPVWHDLEEFEQACQGDGSNVAGMRQAASLLTGPYLQGCYLDWSQRKRQQLDEQAVRMFLQLSQATLETRPQEALDYAQRGLDLDPTAQDCHLLRMHAFLKLGQPERAVKQFTSCQQVLQK